MNANWTGKRNHSASGEGCLNQAGMPCSWTFETAM
jgi:hypothetical protein